MRLNNTLLITTLASLSLVGCVEAPKPELTSMKCEYVKDGEIGVVYGKALSGCDLLFPGKKKAVLIEDQCNDSVLTFKVPFGTASGKLILEKDGQLAAVSNFCFRDKRGMIVDFDEYLATWGGYDPFDDENGGMVKIVKSPVSEDSVLVLPAPLPEPVSGSYSLLYQIYDKAWTMTEPTFIQYVARPEEGGRGRISVAGDNAIIPIPELCLKFEAYVPVECPYTKAPRVEIFFGPYDASNKHGRELSPICNWEPYKDSKFTTDGEWRTVTIPLTEFKHSYKNADIEVGPINLKDATNLSFVFIGDPGETASELFLCVDNFRIVPIK